MKKQKYIVLLLIFVFFITLIQATAINEDNTDETDNWELGLVFYDSTVDGGKTPLTEINWDASDGGYGTGESRVITVQINYRNTNCIKTYQPGELEISIPNLVYDTNLNIDNSPHWSTSVVVGANDSTHTGYDWNFVTGNEPNNKQDTYRFQNANTIESKSNFEGNIQIVFELPQALAWGSSKRKIIKTISLNHKEVNKRQIKQEKKLNFLSCCLLLVSLYYLHLFLVSFLFLLFFYISHSNSYSNMVHFFLHSKAK